MSLDLKRLLVRSTGTEHLMESRQALFDSLHPRRIDRRREPRVPIPSKSDVLSRAAKWRVLDLGLQGLAIQVNDHCHFARGERHRVTLSQGASTVDVEGIVCWTDSYWEQDSGTVQNAYRQLAGISVEIGPSSKARHAWESVAGVIQAAPQDLRITRLEPVRQSSGQDQRSTAPQNQ